MPALPVLAAALRAGRALEITHRGGDGEARTRRVSPLGLVNKAGIWYLVAAAPGVLCFRAARIDFARRLPETAVRPAGFDLIAFWDRWSEDFAATGPRLSVRLRVSPQVLGILPEILGDAVRDAVDAASAAGPEGWSTLTLGFEHELAAATRLAGLGGVLDPPSVRERLEATAREILARYAPAGGAQDHGRGAAHLD